MRKYLYIGIGGFLGAIFRFAIKNVHLTGYKGDIPLNTLFANVTGCFLLAFLLTAAFGFLKMDADLRMGLSTGFLGAYTTFSTLCRETVQLLDKGMYLSSFCYVMITLLLGLAAAYAGRVASKALEGILKRRCSEEINSLDNADGEVE